MQHDAPFVVGLVPESAGDSRDLLAAGIRRALPDAVIVVDHFHLVMLANAMVTEVRQRVTREQLGRRGQRVDPSWAHRRMLLYCAITQGHRIGRWHDAAIDRDPFGPKNRIDSFDHL